MRKMLFKFFDQVMDNLNEDTRGLFDVNIAMVGVTGVGKTTTCNVLLGSNWQIGHTTSTTRKLQTKQLVLDDDGQSVETNIYVTDFPGLGESLDQDQEYLPLYCEHLAQFDAVIWVMSANERQMASVQYYCNQIIKHVSDLSDKLIVGLNKADLVEPMEWGIREPNYPTPEQLNNINERIKDVVTRFNEPCSLCQISPDRVVAYTAKHNWRVWKLFEVLNHILKGGKKMSLVRFARPQHWKPKTERS